MRVVSHSLFGVRYWAQWYADPQASRRFEVFFYIGHDKQKGLYWFQSRLTGARVARSFHQLNSDVSLFKPFLIVNDAAVIPIKKEEPARADV